MGPTDNGIDIEHRVSLFWQCAHEFGWQGEHRVLHEENHNHSKKF